MGKKIVTLLFISLSMTLLMSCLTIEADIVLDANGSGTVSFLYNMSTLAVDISKIDKEKDILPFPIMQSEYETAAYDSDGIQIADYKLSDDGTRYYINSRIAFDSLEKLSLFTGIQFQDLSIGNNKLLTVTLFEPSQENQVSDQTLNLIREKFPEDYFSFKITIPGDIIRVEDATFSDSDVSFKISVEELLSSSDSVSFSVEYR